MSQQSFVPLVKNNQISIYIKAVNNLIGSRGDNGFATVKIEFNDKVLGDCPKFEFSMNTPSVDVNFNTTLSCNFEDSNLLDDIAYKPVVVTVMEILPKEKKQKEEKNIILGQITLDMFPLLKGETKINSIQKIHPYPGSPLELITLESPQPQIVTSLSVAEQILDENMLKKCNLLSVTVNALYSPPDMWTVNPNFMYTVGLPIPSSQEKEYPLVFPNGILKSTTDKDINNKSKKWTNPAGAVASSVYIPESYIQDITIENEKGDFRGKDDHEHRHTAETEKNRIVWNMERRCFLSSGANAVFQDMIAKYRLWPVEVFRSTLTPTAKTKGKVSSVKIAQDEEAGYGFHGVCYVNLAPLLYPGVKSIRGAYKVEPYFDYELLNKTKRKAGIAEEAIKIANNIVYRGNFSPFPKKYKDAISDKLKDKEKKGASKQELGTDGDSAINIEGQMYVDYKSYIILEFTLNRPLVKKKTSEDIDIMVAELIPPRPLFSKRSSGAKQAVEDFHSQVAHIANFVLKEFRNMFSEELKDESNLTTEHMEKRRHNLIYELNSSGKYFTFKEQLKYSVINIVRDKFLKTTRFHDNDELQEFLSELYLYLVNEMHVSLNKVLNTEDQPEVPDSLKTGEQLKIFALEAETNGNLDLARKYYKDRIALNDWDAEAWFDYGVFCMFNNDLSKADECLKECISVDQVNFNGLLLYGIVCTLEEKYEKAEALFDAATTKHPSSIVAWTITGIFHETVTNDILADMSFDRAMKLNEVSTTIQDTSPSNESLERALSSSTKSLLDSDNKFAGDRKSDVVSAAPIARKYTEDDHTNALLSDEGGLSGTKVTGPKPEQKLSIKKDQSGSVVRPGSKLSQPMENSPRNCPTPTSSIYMKTVEWLLLNRAVPFTEKCLAHEVINTHGHESFNFLMAQAQLQIQKELHAEAIKTIDEANKIDFMNPNAWAMFGHTNYLCGHYEEALSAYERTLDFEDPPTDLHSLYLRLARLYLVNKQYAEAKSIYLKACQSQPTSVTWLGVGVACYRMGQLAEAEDALAESNILNSLDPEVWAYLSLVSLQTNRALEAEQSYKYAVKLNLQDKSLLDEICELQIKQGFGNPEM